MLDIHDNTHLGAAGVQAVLAVLAVLTGLSLTRLGISATDSHREQCGMGKATVDIVNDMLTQDAFVVEQLVCQRSFKLKEDLGLDVERPHHHHG